ncbi:hypothetical protein [Chitinophaga sp.]|uniref:hypothetical protein n=1 Tax=Chitinophaga sp. TaxID=1869181 RepID=UPI0031D81935
MKQVKFEPGKILALYATFFQAYMSFYRYSTGSQEEFITYFNEKNDEMNCLRDFIERCLQENINIEFRKYPATGFIERLYTRCLKKDSLSEFELCTAAYFCKEILQVISCPSVEAIRQTKFIYDFNPFSRNILSGHLTRQEVYNAECIDYFYHSFYYTCFSLKEILASKKRLRSIYSTLIYL